MQRDKHTFLHTPCAALRPYVKKIMIATACHVHADQHLPDLGTVAAFTYQGQCGLDQGEVAPASALTGIWQRMRHHQHSEDHAVVLVTFTATGAAGLFNTSMHNFANTTISLESVLHKPSTIFSLQEQLHLAASHHERFLQIEHFLSRYVSNKQPDIDTTAATAFIHQTKGQIRIAELISYTGLSQRTLERKFKRYVGITPHQYIAITRFRHAVALGKKGLHLTDMALEAGYYDQSHFTHDFKKITGQSPRHFFANLSMNDSAVFLQEKNIALH